MTLSHLHRHGEFSVLDGTGTADEYAARAQEMGHTALALTDHGTLAGALHHIDACSRHDLFGIVGVEAYFKPQRQPHNNDNRGYYHMVLLAKNLAGWHSLLRLTSASHRADAFYYKPIIDWDLLSQNSEGLICSTACMAGFVAKHIMAGDDAAISKHIVSLKSLFGDDLYMEIMPNTIPEQAQINVEIANLAMQHSIPMVATTDAHYPCHEWAPTHQILVDHIYEHEDDSLFLMTEDEVRGFFAKNQPNFPSAYVDEAIRNTEHIVSRCTPIHISRHPKYPRVEGGADAAEKILREWCDEGLNTRFPMSDMIVWAEDTWDYRERMDYELGVLRKNDVLDYFVIVGTIVRWAKANGVLVGAGRGSAAGSLVSYLCGITSIDPIAHGLLFERFLNPDRKGMPDIDIDFDSEGRERVKGFMREHYGELNVADIVAYQTYGARSALQTVGRALKISPLEIGQVTATFEDVTTETKLEDYLLTNEKLRALVEAYPALLEHAQRIERQTKSVSKHAAGMVITDRPVQEYMPTIRATDGSMTTAWSDAHSFPIISKFGFLKIDVLGLKALSKRLMCTDLIEQRHKVCIDLDALPVAYDPAGGEAAVLSLFSEGTLAGVFQFEGNGMRRLLKDMKVDHFNDLVAAVALFRPGPMANIPRYIARKTGEEKVTFQDPRLESVLGETYGVYVYQEQAMQIAQIMAGFTGGEADTLRKAIGKKDMELMSSLEALFIHGCESNNVPVDLAEELWRANEASANYSFCKSHAAAYALGAYQDMWLKHHYPLEFYTATLSHLPKGKDVKENKVPRIIREATFFGVKILPPDVNISGHWFTIDDSDNAIRFGIAAIKGMGDAAVNEILTRRPFWSKEDVIGKVIRGKCNAGKIRVLSESGAFDKFGERDDWAVADKVRMERELLGYAISDDYDAYSLVIAEQGANDGFDELLPEETARLGGEIVSVKEINTRKGEGMAFVDIVHGPHSYSLTFFPPSYRTHASLLTTGNWVLALGEKDDRGSTIVHACCSIADLIEAESNASQHG